MSKDRLIMRIYMVLAVVVVYVGIANTAFHWRNPKVTQGMLMHCPLKMLTFQKVEPGECE